MKKIVLSTVLAMSLGVNGLSAYAASISSLPWEKDFEGISGVTLTDSLWDETQTPLDCVFYAQGDELTTGTDTDAPEHGTVLKHISKGSAEKFIQYKIPKRTSGVVSINLDIKHNDTRMLYFKFSNTEWKPVLRMNDGKYELLDETVTAGKTGEYSSDKWYNVSIAINLDEDLRSMTFENDSLMSAYSQDSLSDFYIQMQPDTSPESEQNEILFDNIKINSLKSVAPIKLYSGGSEVKNYALCSDELELVISDSEEDAFEELSGGIELIDMGNNPIASKQEKISLEALSEDGKLKLKLSSPLKEGHAYRLSLPEGARTRFTRKLSDVTYEFVASNDGGMKTDKKGEDFSGLKALNEVKRGEAIAEGSILKYMSAKSNSKKYELVNETECTDGKGLKLIGDRVLSADLSNGENIKSGEYEIEVRYKTLSGTARLALGNSDISSGIPLLETTNSNNTIYMQYSDVASGFEKKYQTASNDGWTTARFIINFDDMTVAYNINGTNGMGNLPYYDPAEKKNLITNGAAFVRFEQDVSNSELILDYISIGTKYESAAVSKVTFTDADGKENAYIKDSVITPEIEKIRVYFIGKADRDSFDSIKVTVDEFDETYSGVFDEETNSYVMTLDNYLKAKSTYNVLIPASVTGTAISGEIKTGEGKYEISSMEFFDEYGLKTNDVLSAKSFRVKIINTVGENKNVTLVCNSHSGYYLKNMFYKNFNIAKRKAELVLPVTIDAEADEVQGFLWSDMNKITPQIKEVVIKKTVSE